MSDIKEHVAKLAEQVALMADMLWFDIGRWDESDGEFAESLGTKYRPIAEECRKLAESIKEQCKPGDAEQSEFEKWEQSQREIERNTAEAMMNASRVRRTAEFERCKNA